MHEIDLTNKNWSAYPKTAINDIPQSFDVCGEDQFVIIQRIGSSSVNGRVYEIERFPDGPERQFFAPVKLALKVFEDNAKGNSECQIASMLGSRYPDNFPRVVSHDACPHVILRNENDGGISDSFAINEESKFRKRFVVNSTMNRLGKKRLETSLKMVHTTGDDLLIDMRNLGVLDETIRDLQEYKGVKMRVMASELLSGDLLKHVESAKNSEETETPRLISEVFDALKIMVRERIVHGDLHLGNVLLRKSRTRRIRAVIHDFGESRIESGGGGVGVDVEDHVEDILFFIHALTASLGERYEEPLVVGNAMAKNLKERGGEEAPITRGEVCSTIDKIRAGFLDLYMTPKSSVHL